MDAKLLLGLVQSDLSKVSGVLNLKIDDVIGDDEINVNIDYQKARRLGLDVKNIGEIIRAAISGRILSKVTLNNKDVDLKIQLGAKYREKQEDLVNVKIMDKDGNLIPIPFPRGYLKADGLSLISTEVFIIFTSSASSLAAITIKFGKVDK